MDCCNSSPRIPAAPPAPGSAALGLRYEAGQASQLQLKVCCSWEAVEGQTPNYISGETHGECQSAYKVPHHCIEWKRGAGGAWHELAIPLGLFACFYWKRSTPKPQGRSGGSLKDETKEVTKGAERVIGLSAFLRIHKPRGAVCTAPAVSPKNIS